MSLLALLLALSTPASASSQGALWLAVEGEIGLTDAVEVSMSEEIRREVLPGGTTELLTEVAARVRLTKGMALQGGYRLGVGLDNPFPVAHRLAADLRLDHRVGDFKLKLRQRYQVVLDPAPYHMIRTRLGAEFRFDPVRPYLSVEPFFPLTGGARLHKVRVTAGVKLPTNGPDLRLFCHFEQQLDLDRRVVVGFAGTFGTKVKKKKKEED